jgi:hypothetical protein
MNGPEWTDLTVPEWYKERAEGLIAKLGEERPDSKVFNAILATGQIEEKVIGHVHFIASRTKETDSLQLAADIVQHSFATLKIMTLIPLCSSK